MRRAVPLAALPTIGRFAAAPETAHRTAAACDLDHTRPDREAARAGRAEARRRGRMTASGTRF